MENKYSFTVNGEKITCDSGNMLACVWEAMQAKYYMIEIEDGVYEFEPPEVRENDDLE